MARLPYLDKDDLAPGDRDILRRGINLDRILAHSPAGARAFTQLGRFIRHDSRLDARLREMAILQVGYATGSPYEYSHHIEIGRGFGVSDDDIRAIAAETAGRDSALERGGRAGLRAARGELSLDPERLDALIAHYRPPVPRLDFAEMVGAQSLVLQDDCGHLSPFVSCSGTAMTSTIKAFLSRDD